MLGVSQNSAWDRNFLINSSSPLTHSLALSVPELNCQTWVNRKIFPFTNESFKFTNESFKSIIVQPLNFGKENCKYPIKLAIINIIEGKCPLLFVDNSANGIHLQPNQLIAEDKVPMLEEDFQQPKKRLVTLETPEEIREAQRKDLYIAK
uniref:Uncharacterized protein n=1 Tax=Romanomermis culicivorax TaxID=13658 RepID=A0A915KJ54_ROMCU